MAILESLAIGRILRPWGRAGEVVVEPWTHDPARFCRLRTVEALTPLARRPLRLESARIDQRGRPILGFCGVGTITEAEGLRGAELWVGAEAAERPTGSAYFVHELVGLQVSTTDGLVLGRVEELLETGAVPILVVRDSGRETLIPLAAAIVEAIDLGQGSLSIRPPEGLIGLNVGVGEHAF